MAAGRSESRVWDDLFSTTMELLEEGSPMSDQVYDVHPLLAWYGGDLGKATTRNKIKRTVNSGGTYISNRVNFNTNTTIKPYSGASTIDTTIPDGGTNTQYEWKQIGGSIGITGIDQFKNSGDQQIADILEDKRATAINEMRDQLNIGLWSDGTGFGGEQVTGLQALVSATTTVGGLAPGTYPDWASYSSLSVGSYASGGKDALRIMYNTTAFGNDRIDAMFTTQAVYEYIEKAEDSKERFVNTEAMKLGFDNITFKGVPIFFDRDCPAGFLYGLNSSVLTLTVAENVDMNVGKFVTPDNQDVSTAKILWYGNSTIKERRKCGVLGGITA
jgi:hypothetical protein